jgi:hypothetical protein
MGHAAGWFQRLTAVQRASSLTQPNRDRGAKAVFLPWILAAALSSAQETSVPTKACADGSVVFAAERCMELPDHRNQFSFAPAIVTHAIDWSCKGRSAAARIRVVELPYANERGQRINNRRFKVELLDLRLDGRRPSRITVERLRTALQALNSLGQIDGRCFADGVPAIVLTGHNLMQGREEPSRAQIELR